MNRGRSAPPPAPGIALPSGLREVTGPARASPSRSVRTDTPPPCSLRLTSFVGTPLPVGVLLLRRSSATVPTTYDRQIRRPQTRSQPHRSFSGLDHLRITTSRCV